MATPETFPFDDDTIEIKPRPIGPPITAPAPEPVAPPVQPSPSLALPSSIKGTVEKDGPTQSEILLRAIVLEARKEQTPVTTGHCET